MPISKEERERLLEMDGTREGMLREAKRIIRAMRGAFGIDEGDMLACVKDAYKDPAH